MPAVAPPSPWSPWAPDCPLPWTAAQRRKLAPRRGSATPVEPAPPAVAWERMRACFAPHEPAWRDTATRNEGMLSDLRELLALACERLSAAEVRPPTAADVEAVVLTLLSWRTGDQPSVDADVIDFWVGTAGLPFAVDALLAATELRVRSGSFSLGTEFTYFLSLSTRGSLDIDRFSLFGARPPWLRLRHLLAVAPDSAWTAAVEAAGRRREGAPLHERIAISFLFPDVLEWCTADAHEALTDSPTVRVGCLATCVRDGDLLARIVAAGRDRNEIIARSGGEKVPEVAGVVFSLVEGGGPAAVPSLVHLLDQARTGAIYPSADGRKACTEALALLPGTEAFEALAGRLDLKEATVAAGAFARRLPRIALPVLAARVAREPKGPAAALLSAAVEAGNADESNVDESSAALVDELLPGLPEASRRAVESVRGRGGDLREATPDELPPVLADPPWARLPKRREAADELILEPLPGEESIVWEEGERDLWLQAVKETGLLSSAVDRFAYVLYSTTASPMRLYDTHPRCWLAEQDSKISISALVKATAEQPEAGIEMCLPFRSPRLAPIVAREHLRRPRVRAAARRWLDRHAECAAVALIPPALGPSGKEREEAEAALLWLAESGHRERVTAAASRHGEAARSALDALLTSDPLLRLPAKLPRLPAFWTPASFSRPRLRGRDAVVPPAAMDALGTMLAISSLGDPYAGIARVREACDSDSLGRFAWDLFSAWLAAGAPSKEAWAYHALAALGDEDCARRLGPLVRNDWPSAGEHNRAITGLDVLEALGSEAALFQLHWISQKGVTRGIRDRAARKLEAVAAGRGLTPDDLEDYLLPAFGLGPDGSLPLDYGRRSFRVGFDELLRPFVQDSAGKRLKDLPKPGAADDTRLAEQALLTWKELKKDVKAVAGQRLRRLEMAMCARRRWDARTFSTTQVQHPLAGHLARRLVWGAWDAQGHLLGTFRICEDQTFADPADDPWELAGEVRVGVVHPFDLEEPVLAAWSAMFADYEILQPFAQLGREVFRCSADERSKNELARYAGLRLPTGKLLGLESRGWKRGTPQDGPVSFWTDRPVAGPRRVATIEFEPGIMNGMPLHHPEQTIARVALVHSDERTPANVTFGDLDPVVFSELVLDLETLR